MAHESGKGGEWREKQFRNVKSEEKSFMKAIEKIIIGSY